MKRRVTITGKARKRRQGKAPNPKGRAASAVGRHSRTSYADLRGQLDRQRGELAKARRLLAESLEQQTATADVLKVISSPPGELKAVFGAMLDNATRICGAELGTLELYKDNGFTQVAMHGAPPAYAEFRQRNPVINPTAQSALGRLANSKRLVHFADMMTLPENSRGQLAKLAGARTLLAVPLLKDDELLGAMGIYRQEARPFTDKQIELVKNFAAQAVIAIENTRLLNELRQRTDDLSESLEQQTATSEVLKVISSAQGALEPVFQSMLANAARICGARFGNLLLFDGTNMRVVATHNAPAALNELRQRDPVIPLKQSILGPLVRTKRLVQLRLQRRTTQLFRAILSSAGSWVCI